MDETIEKLTEKLNNLRIKEAMWVAGGYECPEYIVKDMEVITKTLHHLYKDKTSVSTEGQTDKKN